MALCRRWFDVSGPLLTKSSQKSPLCGFSRSSSINQLSFFSERHKAIGCLQLQMQSPVGAPLWGASVGIVGWQPQPPTHSCVLLPSPVLFMEALASTMPRQLARSLALCGPAGTGMRAIPGFGSWQLPGVRGEAYYDPHGQSHIYDQTDLGARGAELASAGSLAQRSSMG